MIDSQFNFHILAADLESQRIQAVSKVISIQSLTSSPLKEFKKRLDRMGGMTCNFRNISMILSD